MWLIERLLGVNLAWKFYSFFRRILADIPIFIIEESYADIIDKIIRLVMRWEGVYSRCLIVDRLKLICEFIIMGSRTKHPISPKNLLEYLYEEILCEKMEVLTQAYKAEEFRIYDLGMKTEGVDSALAMLDKECKSLRDKYFIKSDGYYFLEENNEDIIARREKQEINNKEIENLKKSIEEADKVDSNVKVNNVNKMNKELKKKEKQKKGGEDFDKRLYALIQKIIICE